MSHRFFNFISSLKLTIGTLAVAIVLIFVGTLAQQNLDAFYAQKQYFNTLFVWWTPPGKTWSVPCFPGGYLIGGVLLVNLLAAHAVRFKLSWKKTGIILTHAGLMMLLVGGLYTSLWSRDTRMAIAQGGTINYAESFKEFELAVIDKSDPAHDTVVSIPESDVEGLKTVSNPALPFTVAALQYFPNARMSPRQPGDTQIADRGFGTRFDAVNTPITKLPGEENYPAAYVRLAAPSGPVGTWLLWASPFGSGIPPQLVTVNGKTYELELRLKRFYKPFQIHLIHLAHEILPGTNIPKNFESKIHLSDSQSGENRDVLIYMNHPLRYGGETFYQFQTLGADSKYSVLEVVQNASWWLPYAACLAVFFGLVFQFGMHLLNFIKRRAAA